MPFRKIMGLHEQGIPTISMPSQRPDWFLDKLLELLDTNRFISIHYTTIHRELVGAGVSIKKLQKIRGCAGRLLAKNGSI
jgi:hypothetical protein